MYLLRCWKRGEDTPRTLALETKGDALCPQVRQFLMDLGIVKFEALEMTKDGPVPIELPKD